MFLPICLLSNSMSKKPYIHIICIILQSNLKLSDSLASQYSACRMHMQVTIIHLLRFIPHTIQLY